MHRDTALEGNQRVVQAVRRHGVCHPLAAIHTGTNDETQQLVGSVADQDLFWRETVTRRCAASHLDTEWVRIDAEILVRCRCNRREDFRRRSIRVLVCVQLADSAVLRLLARHILGEVTNRSAQVG
jgi:hypothetical protein